MRKTRITGAFAGVAIAAIALAHLARRRRHR
ncbi:MAG: hypothetical protein K0R60_1579 [Microbacterium sp.]|nr:hypothetical protein [Microbacterium sp.]